MSKVDWSKAPITATHYAAGRYWRFQNDGKGWERESAGSWLYLATLDTPYMFTDCESRPTEWPAESRIDNIGRNRTEDDMGHYDQEREQHEEKHDPVNKPRHYYIGHDIQAIDIIKASLTPKQFKGYLLGNFLKYRLRAGDKGDLQQDIDKSNWYRERLNGL